jgi:hypothetical protein
LPGQRGNGKLFSSLKIERVRKKVCRSRDQARADVFDYIERFYNLTRRHSTLGYVSPIDFERQAGVAERTLSRCPSNRQKLTSMTQVVDLTLEIIACRSRFITKIQRSTALRQPGYH